MFGQAGQGSNVIMLAIDITRAALSLQSRLRRNGDCDLESPMS